MKKIRVPVEKKNLNRDQPDQSLRRRIRMQIFMLIASILLVMVLIFAMSAAWFTNVAKTSDLVFQTESWGFDADKILLEETVIPISPGASGVIPLSIDNSDGAESVNIGIHISKTGQEADSTEEAAETFEMQPLMDEELQKRIFFYADTSKTYTFTGDSEEDVKEETVSRVYLGGADANPYTYRILPGQKLTMNEIYYNDVPLKWECVYDMLGYYFQGTVIADHSVAVEAYLRPIEYDFDSAVFDRGEDAEETGSDIHTSTYQQLMAVGDVPVEEFLADISETDGYQGSIEFSRAVMIEETAVDEATGDEVTKARYYYPVEIDDGGYGVWAYLCTLDEIEEGMEYDTELASAEEATTATAKIILTANSVPSQSEHVMTEAALLEALQDDDADIVKLDGDISLENVISFTEGIKILDLNGYTLQSGGLLHTNEYSLFSVSGGAELTVINGEITGNTQTDAQSYQNNNEAFCLQGGNVNLSGVKVSGFDSVIVLEDRAAEDGKDSTVRITDCELLSEQVTVILKGNGPISDAMARVIIQNSSLHSQNYVAIMGNGNTQEGAENWGTELILADSEIYGKYGALFQPQKQAVTTITGCEISGNTGIVVKGGSVNIYDSKITGTGESAIADAAAAGSGFTDTGDALYVEAVYDWAVTVKVFGENTELSGEKAYAVELFGEPEKGPGKIYLYAGIYSGLKGSAKWNEIGTFEIHGGTFPGSVSDGITRYDVTNE